MKYYKNLLFFSVIINSFLVFSQNKLNWKENYRYEIDSTYKWRVDGIGNIYAFRNNIISKYDSIGVFKFSESQKRFGTIQSISPVNAMKLIVFSEEQQLICTVDNTLTNYSNCKDLSGFEIQYATFLSASSRPNKLWVFDQLNSTLLLLNLNGEVEQKISNLNNTIGIENVNSLFEVNSKLYIYDSGKGMFSFDIYGSLLHFEDFRNAQSVVVDEKNIIYLKNNKLLFINLKSGEKREVILPLEGIKNFQKLANYYFFRRGNKIYKYQLDLD